MDERPIGMFDSGFGGLTVARALTDLAPHEHLVYVGDTGRYPYGPRDLGEVASFAVQIGRWLVDEHDVKLVVVACNTAAAAGLHVLRDVLPVPVVGVIEPGVRALAKATCNRRVGVIGTVGTISSGAYQRSIAELPDPLQPTFAACPGFVEFVERGESQSDQVHVLAERLLAPLREADIDALLLGCTHYPFLARTIADVVGRHVVLVSSADETAFEVRAILEQGRIHRRRLPDRDRDPDHGFGRDQPLDPDHVLDHDDGPDDAGPDDAGSRRGPFADPAGEHPGSLRFFSSGDVGWFREVGSRLFGAELGEVGALAWPGPPCVP